MATKTKKKQPASKKADKSVKKGSVATRLRQRRKTAKHNRQTARKQHNKISSAFRLFRDSLSFLRQHWRLFGGITMVYFVSSAILVGSLSNMNIDDLRTDFVDEVGETTGTVASFGTLLSSVGQANTEAGAVYQALILVVISLATIWALRQIMAGEKVSVRDTFYKGMYPLVPFLLVMLYLGLLFVPAFVSSFLFNIVFGGQLAVGPVESGFWLMLIFGLMVLSLYLLASAVFSAYIVTLPDTKPLAAIRTARALTKYRRWTILRKLLFLPFAMSLLGALIFVPLIAILPAVVVWVFLALSMLSLIYIHIYVYSLYRELL